jgi:hypothetical protein
VLRKDIFQEAFVMAERIYEQKAHQYTEYCRGFLREEVDQFSRKHEQENVAYVNMRSKGRARLKCVPLPSKIKKRHSLRRDNWHNKKYNICTKKHSNSGDRRKHLSPKLIKQ